MRDLLICAAIAFSSIAPPASAADAPPASVVESGAYILDRTHASIHWTVKHLGLSHYTGRANDFDISLTLDSDAIAKSTVSAVIRVGVAGATSVPTETKRKTIDTGFPLGKDFDTEIAYDPRFLNGGAFPEITFVSTRIVQAGDKKAMIYGDLTLLGVTKEIVLDAELIGQIGKHPFAQRPAVGFRATTTLDRTEFGMGFLSHIIENGAAVVSPEVTIVVNAEFLKAD